MQASDEFSARQEHEPQIGAGWNAPRRQARTHPRLAPARRFPSPDHDAQQVTIRYAADDYAIDPVVAQERLPDAFVRLSRSEEHTSELQSLMRISYAVFCLKKKKKTHHPKIISLVTT